MEGFNELYHKLREAHEREVESWQEKVQELSNKKGCDIKRMEELFNRNQQMREQQRLLTENIKSLENRLRAGLCDRCTVTQDVAKRRQQEYEASQIQSQQYISILATDMNNTKKENKRLREEVRSLRALMDGQSGHSSSSTTPEVKPTRSPDLSPPAEPVALVVTTTAACKVDVQPGGGAVAVKTETDQRTDAGNSAARAALSLSLFLHNSAPTENMNDRRQMRVWNRSNFESYKPLHLYPDMAVSWKTEQSLPRRVVTVERRTQNVEGVERRSPLSPSMPPHLLLLKNLAVSSSSSSSSSPSSSSSSAPVVEAKLACRHLLHAPVPCRPRPFKSSPAPPPWTLSDASDWVGMATAAAAAAATTTTTPTSAAQPGPPRPSPPLPRYPNLIPTSQHANHGTTMTQHASAPPARRQVTVHGWPKQSPPPPPPPQTPPQPKEQSLLFRLRGLSGEQSSPLALRGPSEPPGPPGAIIKAPRTLLKALQERMERPLATAPAPPRPDRTYANAAAEALRSEVSDGPLDLSDRGRAKSNTSPCKGRQEAVLVSEGERGEGVSQRGEGVFGRGERDEGVSQRGEGGSDRGERGEGGSGRDTRPHSSCTPPPPYGQTCTPPPPYGQPQEHHPSDYKTDEDTQVNREETNGDADQTNGKKVPVLTISLRPVVLLESLNAGLLKQESSSSNGKSPSTADPGSSSEEVDRGESPGTESSQGSKRKRRSQDTDTDHSDTDVTHLERKRKMAAGPQETSPKYTGQLPATSLPVPGNTSV